MDPLLTRQIKQASKYYLAFAIIGLSCFVIMSGVSCVAGLTYPPGMDQDGYLAAGQLVAERFVFMWRAPLYSAWIGIIYLLSGSNLELTFYAEKMSSVALLSGLTGSFGWRLFDKWTGLLLVVWVWNCKYLLLETNSSHTLAAALFTSGLLCLTLSNVAARLPLALFMLFLSAMCRSEMWLVLITIAMVLMGKHLVEKVRNTTTATIISAELVKYWLIILIMGCGLYTVFQANISSPENDRLTVAFGQNFAVNYVERKGLIAQYPEPWRTWQPIWNSVLPEAHTPIEAVKKYPVEVLWHALYNLKLSIRALPASVFSFQYPLFMIIFVGVWGLGYAINSPQTRSQHVRIHTHYLLIVFCLTIYLLVPVSIVLRVAARYYIQLIPVEMVLIIALFKFTIDYLLKLKIFSQE